MLPAVLCAGAPSCALIVGLAPLHPVSAEQNRGKDASRDIPPSSSPAAAEAL
jgi:hypothetical protein